MTNPKKLLTAFLALISVFVLTFNTTAWAATATAPTIAPEDALKLRTQITDLQTRLDAFDDLFDDDTSADIEQQLPAFFKDIRSSLSDFSSKVVIPTTQAKYDSITTKLDSYSTKYDDAKAAYSTAKSDYDAATKTYQDAVKSTYDKVVDSLDKLAKLLPTPPTAE
ncbi:hypothetical protein [Chroococcus sp. FPU101]|uniref:hypothetical protein n=1 Tax=Chroococcus sp. FPU101 TaxID=1974212 RepID=UPI001A8F72A8|nr:hypothetical protein [Chroococcus sp. FPU101]GFE67773.1 hypothetical protein CFPU101_03830 [Chroococcus sp. FPU101]